MPTGWARGFVSAEALKRTNDFLAQCRRERDEQERGRIAVLSDKDLAKMMARVIRQRAAEAQGVTERDFIQAGLPRNRLAANFDEAMRLARRAEPKLDAMVSQPCAA